MGEAVGVPLPPADAWGVAAAKLVGDKLGFATGDNLGTTYCSGSPAPPGNGAGEGRFKTGNCNSGEPPYAEGEYGCEPNCGDMWYWFWLCN